MNQVTITAIKGNFSKTYKLFNDSEEGVWKRVGKCLPKIQIPNTLNVEVVYDNDTYNASFDISVRGSYVKDGKKMPSMYVKEIFNHIDFLEPSDYEDKYLTCINTESNNYKFYWLKPDNLRNEINATYGRIGSTKGEMFGERDLQVPYPSYMFWIRYYEKLSKGYIDQSDIYLDKSTSAPSSTTEDKIEEDDTLNKVSIELYETLRRAAKQIVESNLCSTHITQKQVDKTRNLLNQLANQTSVNAFNDVLVQIMVLSPRSTRDVSWLLARGTYDFQKIYNREENLLLAMEALIEDKPKVKKTSKDMFKNLGIQVFEANEKQKEEVMRHLSDGLDKKVVKIYRVINESTQKNFDNYLKQRKIKKVKQFWHGSTNENWLSIIQNGLKLNPNARITGKMFGYGIYFAPRAQKSFGYTSCQGSYWAHGHSQHGYMGLYATAFGKPEYVTSSGGYDELYIRKKNKDCVFAKAENTGLRNDEIIFYNENAMTLNYIVEFAS